MIDLSTMLTETRNKKTMNLDQMSAFELVTAMNQEDALIPLAIARVTPQIAQVVEKVHEAFLSGGRLIYMGAGTSGRLGVLDASECPPTFGVPGELVVGLIAGGDYALRHPVEGAEDDRKAGKKDLEALTLTPADFVIGIAASGRTPYCLGGMEYAHKIGCKTACIVCNPGSAMENAADYPIVASPGPEVLTGSTRLKAGTTQKQILNMITTGAMVKWGKAYENLMVDMIPSNEKLHQRAIKIITEATGVSADQARAALQQGDGTVKNAIVMILTGCSGEEAAIRLTASKGHVRKALEDK